MRYCGIQSAEIIGGHFKPFFNSFKKHFKNFVNYTWHCFSTTIFRRSNQSSSNWYFMKFREPIHYR